MENKVSDKKYIYIFGNQNLPNHEFFKNWGCVLLCLWIHTISLIFSILEKLTKWMDKWMDGQVYSLKDWYEEMSSIYFFLNSWLLSFILLANNTAEQNHLSHLKNSLHRAEFYCFVLCLFLIKGWYKEVNKISYSIYCRSFEGSVCCLNSLPTPTPRQTSPKRIPFENFLL